MSSDRSGVVSDGDGGGERTTHTVTRGDNAALQAGRSIELASEMQLEPSDYSSDSSYQVPGGRAETSGGTSSPIRNTAAAAIGGTANEFLALAAGRDGGRGGSGFAPSSAGAGGGVNVVTSAATLARGRPAHTTVPRGGRLRYRQQSGSTTTTTNSTTATRGASEGSLNRRDSAMPQLYRFFDTYNRIRAQDYVNVGVSSLAPERVELRDLRDLVKYSPSDLLTRAWHLAPVAVKVNEYPPFAVLPPCPDILDVRFGDINEMSHFMCRVAMELMDRRHKTSGVYLRSLLVRAAVASEVLHARQDAASPDDAVNASLDPHWENEVVEEEEDLANIGANAESSSGSSSATALFDSVAEEQVSGPFDIALTLALPSLRAHLTLPTITMLHRIVNKCMQTSTTDLLRGYGVQQMAHVLLRQLYTRSEDEESDGLVRLWCGAVAALLFKIAMVSQSVDMLLSLLRWTCTRGSFTRGLSLRGVQWLVKAVEALNASHLHLSIPPQEDATRQLISLAHPLSLSPALVKGLCVLGDASELAAVLLTPTGAMKVSLKAPFALLALNADYVPAACHGVFVEGRHVMVLKGPYEGVDALDVHTLQLDEEASVASSSAATGGPFLYAGDGRLVLPHFVCGGEEGKQLGFDGRMVEGELQPSTLQLPRTCESVSVQFFVLPTMPDSPKSMTLLTLGMPPRTWLSVQLCLLPCSGTMRLVFAHCGDVVAEVEEAVGAEWTLWSAVLSSTNGVAMWSVYRNGVACRAVSSKTGGFTRPTAPLGMQMLSGTFTGYLAALQLWSPAQSVNNMRLSALAGMSGQRSQFLLCSFRMDEGVGCCLHSTHAPFIWRGGPLRWSLASAKTAPFLASPQRTIPWQPSGAFYVMTNTFELVVIEPGLATWLDLNGRVLAQATTKLTPEDKCFYCGTTSQIVSLAHDTLALRMTATGCPATERIRTMVTMQRGELFCTSISALVQTGRACSAYELALYLAMRMNASLLTQVEEGTRASGSVLDAFVFDTPLQTVSRRTIGRLLHICREVVLRMTNGDSHATTTTTDDGAHGDGEMAHAAPAASRGAASSLSCTDELEQVLLCMCGRLLIRKVRQMERRCPYAVVPLIVEVQRSLQALDEKRWAYLSEARDVFAELYTVILAQCVSHDYQLKLIIESSSLRDVQQLLVPENLPPLIASVIEKDLKKPFMTFLNRLKEECLCETDLLFAGETPEFDVSGAMLISVLGMFAQKAKPQWHLIAAALLCSLCKATLKRFESRFPSRDERAAHMELLKQTSLGVVLFPVAHYLYEMDLDPSIAPDTLRALNETRRYLYPYVRNLAQPARSDLTFVETHTINIPAVLTTPFQACLHLENAKHIHLDVHPPTRPRPTTANPASATAASLPAPSSTSAATPSPSTATVTDNKPWTVQISFIDNNYFRSFEVRTQGELAFREGGRLVVRCERTVKPEATGTVNNTSMSSTSIPVMGGVAGPSGTQEGGASVVVHAEVEIPVEETMWLRDVCLALSHTIVKVTHQTLLALSPSSLVVGRDSIFRGGLSRSQLMQRKIVCPAGRAASVSGGNSSTGHISSAAAGNVGWNEEEDENTTQVHNELCLLAANEGGALRSFWDELRKSRQVAYATRLSPVLRWCCCAMAWHAVKQISLAAVEEELTRAFEWLRKKSFLLLEALQQGRESAIVQRAQLLLNDITPRSRGEAQLSEHQHTEEPVVDAPYHSSSVSRGLSRGLTRSVDKRSRAGATSSSYQRSTGVMETLELSSATRHNAHLTSRRPNHLEAAVHVFSKNLQGQANSLPSQILDFLIGDAAEGEQGTITSDLAARTQSAIAHTAAYKLQEELCEAYKDDHAMLASILTFHLQYRYALAESMRGAAVRPTPDGRGNATAATLTTSTTSVGTSTPTPNDGAASAAATTSATTVARLGFDCHYTQRMLGCGLLLELELQKAACSFVQTALRVLLRKLDQAQRFPFMECVQMCAILCHPWDGVDMSILRPADIFAFLQRLLSTAFRRRLESLRSDDLYTSYIENKGLFDLYHRCLVMPNSLLQISFEGIHIVDGEAQGVHVEDINVVCTARNHWKPFLHRAQLRARRVECDAYANYGLPCVVTEQPDVHYFEVTLEISFNDSPKLAIGLSNIVLVPLEPVHPQNAILYSSDGTASCPGQPPVQFSAPWEVGDVIGCGVLAPFNSVFFTRNGRFLGVVTNSEFDTHIPFIEARGQGSVMKFIVNFGEELPFVFDIAALHCSSRDPFITSAMVCDTALITVHYLVTMCYKNLSSDEEAAVANRDAVSCLLEHAAVFLHSSIVDLVVRLNEAIATSARAAAAAAAGPETSSELSLIESMSSTTYPLLITISHLFHCVMAIIECFRFDSVTTTTHEKVLQLCAYTLTECRDRWTKVRAAQCLTLVRETMNEDNLYEAVDTFRQLASAEVIVQRLVELARMKLIRETEPPPPPPRWMGNTTLVRGKGAFFGSAPMPRKGTHMVGFRIRRRQQQGHSVGSPLGGCYYLGLCHGQPAITSMSGLISRTDMFVLQDTDDQDQVPHLLLRRHCIPRNSNRRIYGHDEVVWVELNADLGEITFYRENMILIGLAFANIQKVDDLYPIVYHFNEDASCEIIPAPTSSDESVELWAENLQRSIALHTLQQLHLVPYFSAVISQTVQRSIAQLDRSIESCLVALAVLGGERSYLFCQHDTFGLVIVHTVAEVTGKAVVYLANDDEKRLFSVLPQSLKPSFVQTPLYASPSSEADKCAALLTDELHRSLYDASFVAPLERQETEQRAAIEKLHQTSLEACSTRSLLDIVADLHSSATAGALSANGQSTVTTATATGPRVVTHPFSVPGTATAEQARVQPSSSDVMVRLSPVVIERQHSTKSLYTPMPSIGVTTAQDCSIIRGNVLFASRFTIAISVTQGSVEGVMYIGLTSSVDRYPERIEEVAGWEDSWPLCSWDLANLNSVNCCVEPSMIFSGDATLFTSRDILLMHVDRDEGTIAFSRLRKGRRVNYGVLFEGISQDALVRPFVACGADTVVVFSFMDGITFPARCVYPASNFVTATAREARQCSVCEVPLDTRSGSDWYCGEDGVALCEFCFNVWQYPRALFFRVSITSPGGPRYLVSRHVPRQLRVGDYVEFDETPCAEWSAVRSVNAEIHEAFLVSTFDQCFAVTEPFSRRDGTRIDLTLGYIAGVSGHPFSGLLSFTPLWHDGQEAHSVFALPASSLAISYSIIQSNTKAVFALTVTEARARTPLTSLTSLFVGVTNLADATYAVTRADLEGLCANNNVWGTWCDAREKISSAGTVYMLVDSVRGVVHVSSSLGGLHSAPFVVTCNVSPEEDQNLRLVLFSYEPCLVTSSEGVTSSSESMDASACSVAVGLVPETFNTPLQNSWPDAVVLADTIHRTETACTTRWEFTPHARSDLQGVLFRIDDTLTFVVHQTELLVFSQGLLVAHTSLSAAQAVRNHRLMLYLSLGGLTAAFVAPLYGRSHLGRILAVHGPEVCVVESLPREAAAHSCYAARRKDVRFCALAASTLPAEAFKEGTQVAFLSDGLQPPKRGTIMSAAGTTLNVSYIDDDRAFTQLPREHCFVLDNESKEVTGRALYPLIIPPTSTITRIFEVGKTRYRLQSKGSYNGIMFDCKTTEAIELAGLSVLSHTTGRHRADVFYRKGSHKNHERDSLSWLSIFSGMVDMHTERHFSIFFSAIHIEAGSTFALYINTSHNCGVGFYCEEDGCQGDVGSEMDDDGTITVYLGRKSGSSAAFGEFSLTARGFCGTIMYKQNTGSRPLLIEGGKAVSARLDATPTLRGDVCRLVSHPAPTRTAPAIRFLLDVTRVPVCLSSIALSVLLSPTTSATTTTPRPLCGLLYCVVSTFYAKIGDLASGQERAETDDGAGDGKPQMTADELNALLAADAAASVDPVLQWNWAWNSRVLVEDTVTAVTLSGMDVHLKPGRYVFAVTVSALDEPHDDGYGGGDEDAEDSIVEDDDDASAEREGVADEADASALAPALRRRDFRMAFIEATDTNYTVRNQLIAVRGLFGEVHVEADTPAISGETHTMITGSFLSQNNSASYNGIMFDLVSREDITLDEVFCVSQTNAERVTVRFFWKEGSMEGYEKAPAQWREVATKDSQLIDRQLFSTGPVYLRMKAHQTYAIYINTTSSCGVRFFNSSDGHVGEIGDEFESDGIVSIYVGRKSESSTPFAEIPLEPRAFRGKLRYRTYNYNTTELVDHAMFSYFRAFIVTRMLVALTSYVDSSRERQAGRYSFARLLTTVAHLATSPNRSVTDLTAAENLLSGLLKDASSEELRSALVMVPLTRDPKLMCAPFATGDLALRIEDQSTVRVQSAVHEDGVVVVQPCAAPHEEEATGVAALRGDAVGRIRACSKVDNSSSGNEERTQDEVSVAVGGLLPLTRCWLCGQLYATGANYCPATGEVHQPPPDEDSRIVTILANSVVENYHVSTQQALDVAKALLRDSVTSVEAVTRRITGDDHSSSGTTTDAAAQTTATAVVRGDGEVEYDVAVEVLQQEQEPSQGTGLGTYTVTCPFVFSTTLQAYVTLHFAPVADRIAVSFVTDLPLRMRRDAVRQEVCAYTLELFARIGDEPVSRLPLLDQAPIVYIGAAHAPVVQELTTTLTPSLCARYQRHGRLKLLLRVRPTTPPPVTPVYSILLGDGNGNTGGSAEWGLDCPHWIWDGGHGVETTLSTAAPQCIEGDFRTGAAWPQGRPRRCAFMAITRGKERMLFLELQVLEVPAREAGHGTDVRRCKMRVQRPFSVANGEVVTLGCAREDGFFILDANNAVRCRLTEAELSAEAGGATVRIAMAAIEPEKVTALLAVPSEARRRSRQLCTMSAGGGTEGGGGGVASRGDGRGAAMPGGAEGYEPTWKDFDVSRIEISKNRCTVRCSTDTASQAVLGTMMPSTGVSAFVMELQRRDLPRGAALGGGHFAGIAVTSFAVRAPHFSQVKGFVGTLWVVQDVQDADSMPNQVVLPSLRHDEKSEEVFCCGTRLLFIVDRAAGTLSLARDDETPRVVFRDVPRHVALCPFVRLDNAAASATLSRYTPNTMYSLLHQTSLEKAIELQPVTASLLRRFSLDVVLQCFPVLRGILRQLPVPVAAAFQAAWNEPEVHTRRAYRVAAAMEVMVTSEVLGRGTAHATRRATRQMLRLPIVRRVVRLLAELPRQQLVVFESGGGDRSSLTGAALAACADAIYFRLPDSYELVGRVPGTNMVRLLYVAASEGGVVERTLHLVHLDDPHYVLHPQTELLPHPSVVRQRTVLAPLNTASRSCGVITDGWYDTTLASRDIRTLTPHEGYTIAAALLFGIEHWHLHGFVHGHVTPSNLYLRVVHDTVVSCSVWNVHYLDLDSPFASPELQSGTARTTRADLWSCARVLRGLATLLRAEPSLGSCIEVLERGDRRLSDVIQASDLFRDAPDEADEGPSFVLRTGTRLRGGSGSYNGIMFDIVAKNTSVRVTKLTFVPDTNSPSLVTLFKHEGSFLGAENDPSAWTTAIAKEMMLSDNVETVLDGFEPIKIPAGGRVGLFLHTTNGSGVLFYSETEGVQAGMGEIEEENNDIGITVGKKSENSQPFRVIQNQKRLLKGSVTYTLLLHSSGPRSSLLHNVEDKSTGDGLARPSTATLELVRVAERGGLTGYRLHTVAPYSLVLFSTGECAWCASEAVTPCELQSITPAERTRLHDTVLRLRASYHHHLLHRAVRATRLPLVRPLHFAPLTQRGLALARDTLHSGRCHPCLQGNLWWISEPITHSAVLSLYQPTHASVQVCLLQSSAGPRVDTATTESSEVIQGDGGAEQEANAPSLEDDLAASLAAATTTEATFECGQRSFLRVDDVQHAVFRLPETLALTRLSTRLQTAPLHLAVRAMGGEASAGGCGASGASGNDDTRTPTAVPTTCLFAFITVDADEEDSDAALPVSESCVLMQAPPRMAESAIPHGVTAAVDEVVLTLANTPGMASEVQLHSRSLMSTPFSVQVATLPPPTRATNAVRCETVVGGSDGEKALTLRDVDAGSTVFVRSISTSRWEQATQFSFLTQSPALQLSERAVRQILYHAASKCVVQSPRLSNTEVHELTLRLVAPRANMPRVALDHVAVATLPPVDLPYAVFPPTDEVVCEGLVEGMCEVVLRLHIDLQTRRVLVFSSTGTVCDALCGKVYASEMQLSVTLGWPGSVVEIVEWRHYNPQRDFAISGKRLASAMATLGVERVSANVAHTAGAVTRHSTRTGTVVPARESGLTAAKQMEGLIVSYARLLLERALTAQEAARRAVQATLHRLLSFTALRSRADMGTILDSELRRGSFDLLMQACSYLLQPMMAQAPHGVEASVNIIALAVNMECMKAVIRSVFGPTLALLLLRTATVYPRATRHVALRCVQELLSNEECPLPSHEVLKAHLEPLLGMMSGLCKRGKLSSAVVQIGVTLVADLIQRYRRHRPGVSPPGLRTPVPYQIVICARRVMQAITHSPPLALPAALVKERVTRHVITCELVTGPATAQGLTASYGLFSEECRDELGMKSFEVLINGPRKGAISVGWDVDKEQPLDRDVGAATGAGQSGVSSALHLSTRSNSSAETAELPASASSPPPPYVATEGCEIPLPCCGYYIEAISGKIYPCLERKRQSEPLKVKVKAGDVVTVSCLYKEHRVNISLQRGTHEELSTNFKLLTGQVIAKPFYYTQNGPDAVLRPESLVVGTPKTNIARIYADLQNDPDTCTNTAPQSSDFYAELNLFVQDVLGAKRTAALLESDEAAAAVTLSVHEVAAYAQVSRLLGADAFAEEVTLRPLRPYVHHLRLFDYLMTAFAPLINLQRRSELFDTFCLLKNLCSKETEERIQGDVMRPFQNRAGRKVHVTIHTMQAQPSPSLGPYPTLMRSVFGQLYLQLHQTPLDTFYASPMFTVKLAGFGSTDAGGPYRDVLSQLSSEIMTAHPSHAFQLNPLFVQCGRGGASAIMPNPTLMQGSQTPLMLEFFGKLLAAFFITSDLLAVELPPLFWKLLLNESAGIRDLAGLDPDIARQLTPDELIARTEEELEERFPGIGDTWRAVVAENPLMRLDKELPPRSPEAAQLLSDRIVGSELARFAEAIRYIQHGFDQVLPLYALQAFRWQKVELLICGARRLPFEAFRAECDIQLPSAEGSMFLTVLEKMTDEDRTLLLRFTTGQSRLPLKGRIKVQHSGSKNALPTSSTCFFTLRIPSYSSIEKMQERLLYAIRQCKAIDADGQARENLILDV